MTASFLASFLIFLVTGVYELFMAKASFLTDEPMIRSFVYAILFLNACYYYYFAAYSEMHASTILKLQNASIIEWWIRAINQTILFGLWFLLHFSWKHFGYGLIILYVSYLLWDWITWEPFKSAQASANPPGKAPGFFTLLGSTHLLALLDFFGLLVTIGFLTLRSTMENGADKGRTPTVFFLLGIITLLYLFLFIAGIRHCRRDGFKIFSRHYWTRPEIH